MINLYLFRYRLESLGYHPEKKLIESNEIRLNFYVYGKTANPQPKMTPSFSVAEASYLPPPKRQCLRGLLLPDYHEVKMRHQRGPMVQEHQSFSLSVQGRVRRFLI